VSDRFRFVAAEVSYFSGKVRPALRRKGIPFVEVLPTPPVMKEVVERTGGLLFIPVVVTPEDETWQDTSDILDALEARFPEPALYPSTPVQRVVSLLFEVYADEFLLLPAMHYRWSFPESAAKARGDFGAFSGDPERMARLADRMAGSLPHLGVGPDSIPAIEAHTRDLLDRLSDHFASYPYLLGDAPSLADCALLGPLYAHLYLDAVPGRLLRETAPRVCHWIERMNHPDPDAPTRFAADDALPASLRPLLELVGRDAVPLLLDSVRAVESWADGRDPAQEEPPRLAGTHETTLRGVRLTRSTNTYALWLLQRPLDAYRALSAADRGRVLEALAGTGCEALLTRAPRHRLRKRSFRLVFEEAARTG